MNSKIIGMENDFFSQALPALFIVVLAARRLANRHLLQPYTQIHCASNMG